MIKKTPVLYVFLALAIAFSVFNVSIITARTEKINEAIEIAKLQNQPAKIELVKISVSYCQDCFDIDKVIEDIKKSNVNVTSEKTLEFSSEEAKKIIKQYDIKKLPSVIVSGEVNKLSGTWNENWKNETNETHTFYIYSSVNPPYVDNDGNIKGFVNLTYIVAESCSECSDLSQLISFFEQQNVKFSGRKTIDYASQEAKDLINAFGIQKIPALVISKDILEYSSAAQVWAQLNTTEKNGYYALHTNIPPYMNSASNKISGIVKAIFLNDSACDNCYDVMANKRILETNFGLIIGNETIVDISSNIGKSLLKQYNITKVPIMLASPDASLYASFIQVWPQVGSIEDNGWYVMRNPEVLGTYKDLNKGVVVNTVTIYGGEFEFQPNSIQVIKGEVVRLTFINAGSVEHDLVIDEIGVKTKLLQPGKTDMIEFIADKTGSFSFYCSVEGHKQQGMEGSINIS